MAQSTVLRKETVLKAKLFSLEKYHLLINKKKKTHYVVSRVPVVCIFPLSQTGELYLISQYRYIFRKTILEEVAGHVDENEDIQVAAKRELLEETGIRARRWKKFSKLELSASVVASTMHFFLATELSFGKRQVQDDEEINLSPLSIDKAVEKVMAGEIFTAGAVAGILMLKELQKREI